MQERSQTESLGSFNAFTPSVHFREKTNGATLRPLLTQADCAQLHREILFLSTPLPSTAIYTQPKNPQKSFPR